MNFLPKFRFRFFPLLAVFSLAAFPFAVVAHIEDADLFDFGSNRTLEQIVDGEPAFDASAGLTENAGRPDEVGSVFELVGGFGTLTPHERPVSYWVRFSDWIVSKFGDDGVYRWTRVFRSEREQKTAVGSFSLDSFNGVYITAIVDDSKETRGVGVRSSGPVQDTILFLGHPSRLMSGILPEWAGHDSITNAVVASNTAEDDFAAHFALVVRDVRY